MNSQQLLELLNSGAILRSRIKKGNGAYRPTPKYVHLLTYPDGKTEVVQYSTVLVLLGRESIRAFYWTSGEADFYLANYEGPLRKYV